MAPVLKPTTPKLFDDAKLSAMIEPLTVRVERLKLNQRTPIPLPESEDAIGQGGGVGYDKESVRALEQWLVAECGGGVYDIRVTDAQGATMQWVSTFNTNDFPERVPPLLQGAVSHSPRPTSTKGRHDMPPTAFPNGFPSFNQMQNPYGQQPQFQPFGYPMPAPPPYGSPAYMMYRDEAKERGESAELRALREENQRRERAAMEDKHRIELERERQASEQRYAAQNNQISELRNSITQITQLLTAQAQNKPQANSELEALKAQIQADKERFENERRDRENRDREREMRDLMRQQAEESKRQIEAMSRQMDAMRDALTAASNNGNRADPMIEMLREIMRQTSEAMKETSRNHSMSIEKIQAQIMHPRDIIGVMRESSQQADQVTDKLAASFGRVIDLQSKVTENALQMAPQGSPIVDMVRDGAGNLKEMAERYMGNIDLKARLQAAQQEQILSAQTQLQMAALAAQSGQPVMQHGGLAGIPQPPAPQHQQITAAPKASKRPKKGEPVDTTAAPAGKKRLGKTDAEWFGPIEKEINQLREGVVVYFESLKTGIVDDQGQPDGASAEMAGGFIAQGFAMVAQHGIVIPAVQLLWEEGRHAEFMEVVLPDAPEQFRADVIQTLIVILRGNVGGGEGMTGVSPEESGDAPNGEEPEGEGDEADDDDDDEDETDDDAKGQPDDGDDAANDGAKSPDRGTAHLTVVPKPKGSPNGVKAANPPRRT